MWWVEQRLHVLRVCTFGGILADVAGVAAVWAVFCAVRIAG